VTFEGACDASGGVPLDASKFVVADDEDNFLRLYDADKGGVPLRLLNVSPLLELRKKHPESDLEAGTRIGDDAYWLTSHGRNKKGKPKPERQFFFGTVVPAMEGELQLIGQPYRTLQEDLVAAAELAPFNLKHAATLAPKEPGGFNIEGMTATPNDQVLLGFRSPVPEGLALLLTLENPREVLTGARPKFGEPLRLDFGGLGVRGLSWWRGKYLIVAGPPADGPSRLYSWVGPGHAPEALSVDLSDYNPEGFFTPETRDEILLLSDDGTRLLEGQECKSLKDPAQKRFRGVWLEPY
jgi:hypothetical protein